MPSITSAMSNGWQQPAPARRLSLITLSAVFAVVLVFTPQPLSAQTTTTPSSPIIPNPVEPIKFTKFDDTNRDQFRFLGNSTTSQNALQITPDSKNQVELFMLNQAGRVVLNRPFKIWHKEDDGSIRLASFSVSFDVNIFYDWSAPHGEGVALAILPNVSGPPPGSSGGFLGLTNATNDGDTDNKFVAVELDTSMQEEYDPDNNHIALDVNGVKHNPNVTVPLFNATGFNLTDRGAQYKWSVYVDYNGSTKSMNVFMGKMGDPKPGKPLITSNIDLSKVLSQMSYFGFSASTGPNNYELHCVLGWSITIEALPVEEPSENTGKGWGLKAGLPAGIGLLVLVVIIVFYVRRQSDGEGRLGVKLKSMPGMPREFKYEVLKKATSNFDDKNRLGQGGYGTVYHGRLSAVDSAAVVGALADEEMGSGHNPSNEVAVKLFSKGTKQDDFYHELAIINRLRHRNLVRLEGWCYKKGKLLLVYEYMPHGSLDKHLFHSPDTVLSWDRRYKILTDVASALQYLHNEYDQTVIHRDLKASNIMLDSSFNARLGDFGLARAVDVTRGSYTEADLSGMPGTLGYVAPECHHTHRATPESDVFGFGAVVLEVVCGRRPLDHQRGESSRMLADWVWKLHRDGRLTDAVDMRLRGSVDEDEADRLLLLGLACSHPVASERPKAQEIVQIMYKTRDPPVVPLMKPHFVWPPMPDVNTSGITPSTTSYLSSLSNSGIIVGSGVSGGGEGDATGTSGYAVLAARHVSTESPPEYNSDHYLTSATDVTLGR